MDCNPTRDKVSDLIDRLLAHKDRSVIADINASQCRTKTDWRNAHEAEDKLDDCRRSTIDVIVAMIDVDRKK